MSHIPVMLAEMLAALKPRDGEVYVDGTFGAGGYSEAMLQAAECRVFAIDRDPSTERFAEILQARYPGRFVWLCGRFSEMCALLAMHGVQEVDGVVLDIGVSSMQLDQKQRGFSFMYDAPLDMRMGGDGATAAHIVNTFPEAELTKILLSYGEERAARRIAKAITKQREIAPLTHTKQLADLIAEVVGRKDGKDPATRTFQALRIFVNDELAQLEQGLQAAEHLLKPGGRLVVVSFHSLEDRIAKNFMDSRCGAFSGVSRHVPMTGPAALPSFFKLGKWRAGDEEVAHNPRARSALMRAIMRREASHEA